MTKHYALIPAKERSARCPDKNWRPFAAEANLVLYLISLIPEGIFNSIILSTDKKDVPPIDNVLLHRRDRALSTVESPVNDLISLIIKSYGLDDNGYLWLLNPTSPFRRKEDFTRIREMIEIGRPKSLISVSKVPPFLWRDETPLFETSGPRKNTQDFTTEYGYENGQFIVFQVGEFRKTGTWYSDSAVLYRQSGIESSIDIDTEDDFLEAQLWACACIAEGDGMGLETMKNETLMVDRLIKAPVSQHMQVIYNHMSRYSRAIRSLNICREDVVIDASCGLGYGSYLISLKAKEVAGLDVNSGYIAKARELFGSNKVGLYTYSEFDGKLINGHKADKLVCIETFEHIEMDSIQSFIEKLLSYLKTGGDMYLTAPLGDDGPCPYNEYHLNEPSIGNLYDMFARRFDNITLEVDTLENTFGHKIKYCSVLLRTFTGDAQ